MKTKETTNRGKGKCIIFLMVILFSTVSFSAHAKSYGFKIGGVEVTSDNYSNVTGDNISGIVKYNTTTNTVTLTNVTINRTSSDGRCIDNFNNSGLIVELKGTNNLTAKTSPVKLQKETTFKATSGSTTNIEGREGNANGIYVTAERGFNVNFEGTGTINIKSDNDAAFWRSSYDSYAPIRAFFKGPKVNIQGVKGDLVNIDVTFSGGEVTLKATNSQSTPNVISCGITLQGKMAILKPWGATVSGNTIKVNNPVYSTDILISSNYVALLTEDYFPDTNFRNFLQNIYTKGYITESDVAAQTSFDVSQKSIGSLTGIKYFTELKTLNIQGNTTLSYVGLTNNKKLETLVCSDCNISTLIISALTKLKTLDCSNNALSDVNLTNNTALEDLNIANNSLSLINVSRNTALKSLNVAGNSLNNINVGNNTNLMNFDCSDNNLTALGSMSTNTLETLICGGNNFTTLTVEHYPKLKTISCPDCPYLKTLKCRYNALKDLNCYECKTLETIDCRYNALTSLSYYVSTSSSIKNLYIGNNNFFELGIERLNNLEVLDVSNNQKLRELRCTAVSLQNLNMSGCLNLELVKVINTLLTSLDLSDFTNLSLLHCVNNSNLKTLSVSGCTKLDELDCSNNSLTSLDLSGTTQLRTLNCQNNSLESLDVSGLDRLEYMYCQNNSLKSLDVSGHQMLRGLACYNNSLISLNLSGLFYFDSLNCSNNLLTSLDLTGLRFLKWVHCNNNCLTSLTLPENIDLYNVECYSNRLQGSAMDKVFNSLNTFGEIYAINLGDPNEQNIVTTANVSTAISKDWDVYYSMDGENWTYNYPGTYTPNPIATDVQGVDANVEDNSPRYNLGGQRVKNDYKGIVVVGGKKVVVKE